MNTMAEVLVAHRFDREKAVCACSDEVQVGLRGDKQTHAEHVADALAKAGYGKLADAWNEGHESGFWNGRESAGNVDGLLIGVEHAREHNPYGTGQ